MLPEQRFILVQERAYEIFCRRDPNSGSEVDDWLAAEQEIEKEQETHSMHTGPARFRERSHWGVIVNRNGEDMENPA